MIVLNMSLKIIAPLAFSFALISCSNDMEISNSLAELKSQSHQKDESLNSKNLEVTNPGKDIFKKLNCGACHMKNASIVGPSLKKIRKNYEKQEKELLRFLLGEGKPKIDPEEYEKMAPSIEAFQNLSKEDQQKLIDFLLDK